MGVVQSQAPIILVTVRRKETPAPPIAPPMSRRLTDQSSVNTNKPSTAPPAVQPIMTAVMTGCSEIARVTSPVGIA